MNEPAQVEWPSEWQDWGQFYGQSFAFKIGDSFYADCPFDCDKGFLPAPDGSAGKCPHCLD